MGSAPAGLKMAHSLFKRAGLRLRAMKYRMRPGISIGRKTHVFARAHLEIRHGGRIEIGERSEILEGVLILTYGGTIRIGDESSINPYTLIYGHGNTTIGSKVLIAGHCMIIPSSHQYRDMTVPIGDQGSTAIGIRIHDDVWIGHGCSILDGVTIGTGSVVAAGSVVVGDVPPFTVVAGSPARVVRDRRTNARR